MTSGLQPDAERMMAIAREISFPRYPGTEGDRRAIEIVARSLREAGLEVGEEPFSYDIRPAFRAIRAVLIGTAAPVAAASIVALHSTLLAGILLLSGMLAGAVLVVWAPGAERIYSRPGPTRTANVAGVRPAHAARLTLILMAHHDSKSQNLTFPWRMGLTLSAILGIVGLAGLLVAAGLAGRSVGPGWLTPGVGGVAVAALLVLSTLTSGNESPGGVDNGGSVAILLELARLLPGRIDRDVELIFLSTGAEEDHMVGAMRWLDAHRAQLSGRPVFAVNFDGAGSPGRAVLIERFGFGRAFSPRLSAAARRVAGRENVPVRGIWMPPAMGIDAIPFAHRGVECLTLSSGSLGRATIAVHSAADVAANLDPATLELVARLGGGLALEIARRSG